MAVRPCSAWMEPSSSRTAGRPPGRAHPRTCSLPISRGARSPRRSGSGPAPGRGAPSSRRAGHLDLTSVAGPPEVSGPGFINITLHSDWIAAQASEQLAAPRLGLSAAEPAEKVVVDYSGPNVAKELHVGHLRATIVGDAIVRILEYLGHTVIRAAHLGDWGTPFGMLIEHVLDVGEEVTH